MSPPWTRAEAHVSQNPIGQWCPEDLEAPASPLSPSCRAPALSSSRVSLASAPFHCALGNASISPGALSVGSQREAGSLWWPQAPEAVLRRPWRRGLGRRLAPPSAHSLLSPTEPLPPLKRRVWCETMLGPGGGCQGRVFAAEDASVGSRGGKCGLCKPQPSPQSTNQVPHGRELLS